PEQENVPHASGSERIEPALERRADRKVEQTATRDPEIRISGPLQPGANEYVDANNRKATEERMRRARKADRKDRVPARTWHGQRQSGSESTEKRAARMHGKAVLARIQPADAA